jgi:hypothetical protein
MSTNKIESETVKENDSPSKLTEDKVKELTDLIKERTKKFDPKDDPDAESEFTTTDSMGFMEMVNKVASSGDKCLLVFGLSNAAMFGASLPAFCLFFGEMIDDM